MKFLKNMLRNKNVLITGCNRGIGLSIMRLLAEHGANIWACCRTINDAFWKIFQNWSEFMMYL